MSSSTPASSPLLLATAAARETGADPAFRPAALIFDCDGTVLDTMEWYYPSWEQTCGSHGIAITRQKFYSCAGIPVREIFAKLLREQELEGTVDVDELLAEKHAIVEAQRKVSVPGMIDCVCDIVKHNHGKVPMAIASSGIKKNVLEGLKENGMLRYFDAVITHEDVASGKNKPAPDIFLLAAERLGVEPTACRGFEDADVGMESLRAAGMDAVDVRKMAAYPHKFDFKRPAQ